MTRNWKHVHPNSLAQAFRMAKDYAKDRHNLSVERIADLMGVTHDTLYKWLASGRMPAVLIPVYEHACGCQFVTKWLAASGGKLVIDIPAGRTASAETIQELQQSLHTVVGCLMAFYGGSGTAEQTLPAIVQALEGLGWHHHNVSHAATPELDFGGTHE